MESSIVVLPAPLFPKKQLTFSAKETEASSMFLKLTTLSSERCMPQIYALCRILSFKASILFKAKPAARS